MINESRYYLNLFALTLMQDIKDFMQDFFRARIVEEQNHQTSRLPFRRKYFTESCRYDSHSETLQRMESERIVSINEGESDSGVVTEQTFNYSAGTKTIRLRYQLQIVNNGWVIRNVQTGCFVCEGRGDSNCPSCKGDHWLSTGHVRS